MATADETMEKLLEAILTVKSIPEFEARIGDVLRHGYNEVSALAWKDALETFARHMERGMVEAHKNGIPPQECVVPVTDVIMAARGLAAEPKQVPDRSPRPSSAERGGK